MNKVEWVERWEHKAEIFRRVSHQSEYMEENRKEQKEKYKRKRGGIAVGNGFEREVQRNCAKQRSATVEAQPWLQLTCKDLTQPHAKSFSS